MNRLLKAAAALVCAVGLTAFASTSAMTATASDTDGQAWNNCTFTATLIVAGQPGIPVTMGGVPVTPAKVSGSCNSSGVLTATLTDTSSDDQPASVWVFSVQSNTSAPPVTVTTQVVGATPNLTPTFSQLTAPRFPAGNDAFGYADGELLTQSKGQKYYNVTTPCLRQYSLAGWTCGGGGGGGATGPALVSGASGDYSFKDGSGTSVADASGNGNTATFTANAPVWVTNGLSFTSVPQGVSLPSALNGSQTFEFAVYVNPLTAAALPSNTYPMILNSSQGTTGLTILTVGQSSTPMQFFLQTFANGGGKTIGAQPYSGFHVLTVVCGVSGTNVDHFYIDGVESPYAGGQGASCGAQTGGNLIIGSSGVSPYQSSGLLGTMYRARFFSTQLTAAQVKQDAIAMTAEVASRGIATAPVPLLSSVPLLHAIGDSITCAYNGTICSNAYSWDSQMVLTNQPAYAIMNWGIYNVTIAAISGSEINRVAQQCISSGGSATAILFAGTNDLTKLTATVTFGYLVSEIQTLKTAGCRVYAATMLSRTGTSSVAGTPTMDAQKDSYDALILQSAKTNGADGIIDFAANPSVGADGANTSGTYFLADHIHLTAAGEGQLAIAASNALNYYNGYSLGNPNVVTATTYTMVAGDRAITAAPTANAAYTMPDCTGPSGEAYTISNPQAAFTLTITGGTSQPINGLTSAITIPSNSTVTLRDVANPKTTSGCHWVM